MSSSKPRPAASSSADLPADALYEVLLRIPAKELCRLRAVCPAWRALTSDPLFVAAHKSRHHTAPPLLAVAYCDDGKHSGVVVSDLSGNVVKRIPNTDYEVALMNVTDDARIYDSFRVVLTRLDLICLNWVDRSRAFWVLNPATGATIALPVAFSEELEPELEGVRWCCQVESCALGMSPLPESTRRSVSLELVTGRYVRLSPLMTPTMDAGGERRTLLPISVLVAR